MHLYLGVRFEQRLQWLYPKFHASCVRCGSLMEMNGLTTRKTL